MGDPSEPVVAGIDLNHGERRWRRCLKEGSGRGVKGRRWRRCLKGGGGVGA
ncbi:hypothetical protein HanIR_Chr10g0458641 [Helianthus annuus]|nr:hypothetical protein HanIR_Chr10g0458641 [Helianthus annuus]